MATMKFFAVAIMIIELISSAAAREFIITRNSTQKLTNSVFDSIDKFNISECSSNDDLCTKYGGQELYDRCQCICSQEKSTFGFYNGQWGCTDNSIVQKYPGCRYALQRPDNQGDNNPLFTLPVLGGHSDNNFVGNIPINTSCKVIAANATFLKCDGTWRMLTESSVKRKLSFQDQHPGLVYVGPYQQSAPADPSLDGRVIRIPIKCEDLTWNSSQCVAFKIKGQLTCTYLSGSFGNNPPVFTDESTKPPPLSSTTTPNGTGDNNKSKGGDTTPSAAVIAGSVAGGVAFAILIAVIIVMIAYCKRRKARAKRKSVRHAQENLAYEQGPDRSMTLTTPTSIRPLPEPPSQLPYEYLERGPSMFRQSNGIIPVSSVHGPHDHSNGEPVYGEIDETYSRLNHQPLQPTRSRSPSSYVNVPANEPTPSFSSEVPNKMSTLKSDGSGSGLFSFEEYDVVEGQIKSTLPIENTLKPAQPNSLGRDSNSATYDVPECVIRSSSAERPKSSIEDNATVPSDNMDQPLQRDTPKKDVYETVWDDDDDDDLVARIELS